MVEISLARSKRIFTGAVLEARAILSGKGDDFQDPYSRAGLPTPRRDSFQAVLDCFAGGQAGIVGGTMEFVIERVVQAFK